MNDTIKIRMATEEDARPLLEIYTPYITDTVITFEYEVPTVEEFAGRIRTIRKQFPYLVAVENGRIVGYAYASPYKARAAYNWSVETSIYIDRNYHGKGIGSMLYETLFALLKKQGICNVFACVTLPNEKSEAIHNKFGFSLVGRFQHAGYKFDGWYDIGWFEMQLNDTNDTSGKPKPVIPIGKIEF